MTKARTTTFEAAQRKQPQFANAAATVEENMHIPPSDSVWPAAGASLNRKA